MSLQRFSYILLIWLAPAFSVAADQRLSDLLLQVQRLQEEVQQLRGRLEVQQHDIATLRNQLREQYLDLDARLRGREAAPQGQGSDEGAGQVSGMQMQQASGRTESQLTTATGVPPAATQAVSASRTAEKQAYSRAFDLMKQRRYEDAMRAFEDLLVRYPKGEFADNSRYWLGEAKYVLRDYSAALTEFQRVLANYPLSPKIPASLLKIGYIHYDQGNWKRARTTLQDVVEKFPDTAESRLAESRLERMTREGH